MEIAEKQVRQSMGAAGSPRHIPELARQNDGGQNDEAPPPIRPAQSMASMILPLHCSAPTCAKSLCVSVPPWLNGLVVPFGTETNRLASALG
jgi:hypothetical protein